MNEDFKGVIKLDVRDSTADWTPYELPRAPEGAPNVLVVLYDDTGLASWSPFGGRINMPTLQKLADNGLTYSQWHTTALCSPTRSCMSDRTQPPREPLRLDHRGVQRLSGCGSPAARGVRHHRAGAAGQRLQHVLVGQEPQRARGRRLQWWQQVRVAAAEGLRPVLRLPRRRDQPVVSRPGRGQPLHRTAVQPRGRLPPVEGSGRSGA